MASEPNFQRRASDRSGASGRDESPRERRKRKRRIPKDLKSEIEPMLEGVEPEVRKEIKTLIKKGKVDKARKTSMSYAIKKDRSALVQKIMQKKERPVEKALTLIFVIASMAVLAVALYCILCLLTQGHIVAP